MEQFDYIIIGAGSSGCVMAYRLSEDPSCKVLLIEAGPPDTSPLIHMPKGIGKALRQPQITLPFQTEAREDSGGKQEFWMRGKTLGGSSAVNGMMYVRGQPADYDEVERIAGPNWSWNEISKAYKALENHELGAAATRGTSGPLHITMPRVTVMNDALVEAGAALGLPRKRDVNEPDNGEAVGYAPCTVYKGKRESAAVAFLNPIKSRPNLRIETGITIDKMSFSGNRLVSGVSGTRDGQLIEFGVSREVILAAGALASPAILQRSGVGDAASLGRLGIEVLHDNPRVGTNLREHRALVMQWRIKDKFSTNASLQGPKLVASVGRYYLRRSGIMADATYAIGVWFKTRPDLDRPDGQLLIAPHSLDFNAPTIAVEKRGGLQICAYILRPESSGSVTLRSKDPKDLAIIVPDYRSQGDDREKMIGVVRFARKYVRQQSLQDKVLEETRPGPALETDDEIISVYDRLGQGAYHACGTCRMGLDGDSVVDENLRVRGVEGVRVIDTSILPFIASGNTQGPAMAMAWRGADLILAGH